MILKELTLHNFGPYKGKHSLCLDPVSRSKPIVLVGALNGAGKTSILDALQLVLYGHRAELAGRNGMGYERYLGEMIHRGVSPEDGASIELRFNTREGGETHEYQVRRIWRQASARVRETVEVRKDRELVPHLSETWNQRVDGFIPRGIAPLFFFDAEKVEKFADLDSSRVAIEAALSSLLGMDLVDRLTADLMVMERQQKKEILEEEDQSIVKSLENRVEALRDEGQAQKKVLIQAKDRLRHKEREFDRAREALRAEGSDLLEAKERLVKRQEEVKTIKKQKQIELRRLAEGPLFLAGVSSLLEEATQRAEDEERNSKEVQYLSWLQRRDESILKALSKKNLGQDVSRYIEKVLGEDRKTRRGNLERGEGSIGLSPGVREALDHLLKRTVPDAREAALEQIREFGCLSEESATLADRLREIPDDRTLAQKERKRMKAEVAVRVAEAEVKRANEQSERLKRESVAAETRLERAVRKADTIKADNDDRRRVAVHSERVRGTLEALKSRVIAEHITRIEEEIRKALGRLLRKKSLIQDFRIDRETMQVSLTGGDGEPLSAERLSAGERQLLAIAILWGLATSSERALPVVIDTPLGRLDGIHRDRLLTKYFPAVSHQVLLLSTDEEIEGEAYSRLRKAIGREYLLEYSDKTKSTSVRQGYFG